MIGLEEALAIHQQVVAATGGSHGVRDMGGLEAALSVPMPRLVGWTSSQVRSKRPLPSWKAW